VRTSVLVVSLLGLLALATGTAGYIWWELREVELSLYGTLALTLGVSLSLGLGVGLMYLVFYSARRGHDDGIG
tara:strand:- start:339 stop:557 length:219 start_codon:yes stop_codon:yes gene_type:complete